MLALTDQIHRLREVENHQDHIEAAGARTHAAQAPADIHRHCIGIVMDLRATLDAGLVRA